MIDPRLNFPSISNIYPEKKWSPLGKRTIRSTPSYRAIPSCLVEGSRSEEWKKNKRWNAEGRGPIPRPSIEILPSTRVTILFSIFFKIFAFNFKDRRNSTRFSSVSRVVTLRGKKKKRENKREEKERGGEMEGSEGGRRRKQRGEERVAHNGANEKEEGERVRKRKKNRRGRDVSSRAFHFPCLSFLPSPPARQRSFRRGTRSQVFSGPIRDEVSNGKFERINHFPRG